MGKFDSIMFDMDGTLWDAVDSYCAVWNKTTADFGLDIPIVTRPMLEKMMGMPLADIYANLIGDKADKDAFIAQLSANEASMMPVLGGKLYPGVRATLEQLSKNHKLFMVSNCDAAGLPNFYKFTGLGALFKDGLSYGRTKEEKDVNIRALIGRYNLESPLYIGDVQHDCRDAHSAGIPFAWASYGFGRNVTGADYTLRSISELQTICQD